ncbi:hypothetical protein Moror_11157 [Moniliophthora roreri MCA 2997]|nr:hypothetical protein Moror_11157 [Moniliophthora roreri MCA 2997]
MQDAKRPSHSASSSLSLSSTLLDDQDEDVRIAVRALGDMRNSGLSKSSPGPTPALSEASTSSLPTPSLSTPVLSPTDTSASHSQNRDTSEPDFVKRVSHIPLVNGALRMYEQGKASSRVVKYGAEIMESGVKTISRPVIDRLPSNTVDGILDRVST